VDVTTARNVAIVLALAAVVHFLPGGGEAATVVGAVLSTLILASFVAFGARWYLEHRLDLESLGERWRLVLYGSIALIVFAMAARDRLLETSGGVILWLACLVAAGFGLYRVWRRWREYA
jgi:hypothetical protein